MKNLFNKLGKLLILAGVLIVVVVMTRVSFIYLNTRNIDWGLSLMLFLGAFPVAGLVALGGVLMIGSRITSPTDSKYSLKMNIYKYIMMGLLAGITTFGAVMLFLIEDMVEIFRSLLGF